jgi:hypothetical protein
MRKTILGGLIAGAFAISGGAQAALSFDLNGSEAGGQINATSFDWTTTSFFAQGGNSAISSFAAGTCATVSCSFDVYTHAKLIAYNDPINGATGIDNSLGEITMVAKITETVTSFLEPPDPLARFRTTGAGYVEFYYNSTSNSNDLTGSGFNDGRLIGRLEGIEAGVLGTFSVDSSEDVVSLDGTSGDGDGVNNDYEDPGVNNQLTVQGSGSQGNIGAGLTSKVLDETFFLTLLSGFTLNYVNISIGIPYLSADPSDCFNTTARTNAQVGTDGFASTCDTSHQQTWYAGQVNGTGTTPNVGPVNGLDLGSPDFVAQTDFNSAVTGAVPEPGSLALVGLAIGALGFVSARRRRN